MKTLKNMATEIHSLQKSNAEMYSFCMNHDDEDRERKTNYAP